MQTSPTSPTMLNVNEPASPTSKMASKSPPNSNSNTSPLAVPALAIPARPTSAHSAREDPRSTLHPIPSMAAGFPSAMVGSGGMNTPTSSEREREREHERDRDRDVDMDRAWSESQSQGGSQRGRQSDGSAVPTGLPTTRARSRGGDSQQRERDLVRDRERVIERERRIEDLGSSRGTRRSHSGDSSSVPGVGVGALNGALAGVGASALASVAAAEQNQSSRSSQYSTSHSQPRYNNHVGSNQPQGHRPDEDDERDELEVDLPEGPMFTGIPGGNGGCAENGFMSGGGVGYNGSANHPASNGSGPSSGYGHGTHMGIHNNGHNLPSSNGNGYSSSTNFDNLSMMGGINNNNNNNMGSNGTSPGNHMSHNGNMNGNGNVAYGYTGGQGSMAYGMNGGGGGGGGGGRMGHAQMVARKQNVACDACRGRKVKCNRQPGEDNCESCKAKGLDCTSHYVSQIASYRKNRQATMQALSAASPGHHPHSGGHPSGPMAGNGYMSGNGSGHGGSDGEGGMPMGMGGMGMGFGMGMSVGMSGGGGGSHGSGHERDRDGMAMARRDSYDVGSSGGYGRPSGSGDDKRARPTKRAKTSIAHRPPPGAIRPNHNAEMEQDQLIAFLLSPTYIKDTTMFAYVDDPLVDAPYQRTDKELGIGTPLCDVFFDPPSPASGELVSPDKRKELALDLIETFFQIVHIRHTVLVPEQFRRCFAQPFGPDGPLSPAILALVLAWGAKYSEHPIINEDRQYHSRTLPNGRQRCRIAQMLASRAQQILEADKIYRRPAKESLQALLLMNVLVGSNMQDPRRHRPYWEGIAMQHIRLLDYNRSSTYQNLVNKNERAQIGHLFWYTVWADAFSSVFYRALPQITDDGYDVEPMHTWSQDQPGVDSTASLSQYLSWHTALGSIAQLCRTIANHLWIPKCEKLGIPLESLNLLAGLVSRWRDEQLVKVGVPSAWPSTWDFLAASEACTIDCTFHCLWIVIASAVDDFGIRESRQADLADGLDKTSTRQEVGAMQNRIHQEALNGALRVSALAGVLASNNYLRLDPDILFHPVYVGGRYLAQRGRKETEPCIKGLRQLGLAYEEVFDRVEELEELYSKYSAAPPSQAFQLVASAAPLAPLSQVLPSMVGAQPPAFAATAETTLPSLDKLGVARLDLENVAGNPWFSVRTN